MVKLAFVLEIIAILLCVLLIGCAEDVPITIVEIDLTKVDLMEYFPLNIGNSWEYQLFFDEEAIGDYRMELTEKIEIANREPELRVIGRAEDIVSAIFFKCNYRRLSSELGNVSSVDYYAISGSRVLYAPSTDLQQTEFFGPWGVWPGILFFLVPEMIVGKETVTVPRGTFACIKITRENSANNEILDMDPTKRAPTDLIAVNEWYAIGVGMIKREYKQFYRSEYGDFLEASLTYQLTKYELKN